MKNKIEHYYGLDIIRIVFIWAIVNFHVYETFFYQSTNILPHQNSIYSNLEFAIKTFTFSGFGLITLSSFLLGWIDMDFKKWKKLFSIFLIGTLTLAWLQADMYYWFYFEWDVYNFLFACFLLISILQFNLKILYATSFAMFLLLFFPIWNFDYLFNDVPTVKNFLLGNCLIPGLGGWPIFPWIGMVMASYSIAKFIRNRPKVKLQLHTTSPLEITIWLILIGLLWPWLGTYSLTPMGSDFACFTHRRPPIEFFSHWILLFFLIRISLISKINNFLSTQRWMQSLSSLHWNKHLGLTYCLQFVFLNIGYNFRSMYLDTPFLLDLFILLLFVGVELTSRLIQFIFGLHFLKKQT